MCPFNEWMSPFEMTCVYLPDCPEKMYVCAGNSDAFCFQVMEKAFYGTDFDDDVKIKGEENNVSI